MPFRHPATPLPSGWAPILGVSALAVAAAPAFAATQTPTFVRETRMVPPDLANNPGGSIRMVDVDADGRRDLIARINSPTKPLAVYLADADGVFGPPQLVGEDSLIEAGEFNGDAFPDLVVRKNGLPLLLAGNGTGAFVEASGAFPSVPEVESLVFGDLEGDGDLDGVFVQTPPGSDKQLHYFENDGAGTFTHVPVMVLLSEPQSLSHFALIDFDGDGDLDLMDYGDPWINGLGGLEKGETHAYRNDGPGTLPFVFNAFTPVIAYSAEPLFGDIDGDGFPDAVRNNREAHFGNGAGIFTHVPDTFGPEASGDAVRALFDFDDDGDLDALILAAGSSSHYLSVNDGTGTFSAGPSTAFTGSLQASFIDDLDGDGDGDVIDFSGKPHLLDESGTFVPLYVTENDYDVSASVIDEELGDVDGDGALDALRALTFPDEIRLLRNDGFGVFDAEPIAIAAAHDDVRLELADLDGNGTPDLYRGSEALGDALLLNDGTGAFTPAVPGPPVATGSRDALLVDADGDGDLDVVRDSAAGKEWLVNDGSGTFSAQVISAIPSPAARLAALDVESDGDPDLAFVSTSSELYLNNGAGVFTLDAGLSGNYFTTDVVAADYDLDGDDDLVLARTSFNSLRNDAGVFVVDAFLPPVSFSVSDIAAGDIDADGDIDFALDGPGGGSVYVNSGAGFAVEIDNVFSGLLNTDLHFADFDRDGDLDLLTTRDGIWRNTLRQATWLIPASPTKDFAIGIDGEPSMPWAMLRSLDKLALDLPPFGLLMLSPFTEFAIDGAGVVDVDGQGRFVVPVPNDPALVGLEVFWQAAVGTPLRLTNLVSIVVGTT